MHYVCEYKMIYVPHPIFYRQPSPQPPYRHALHSNTSSALKIHPSNDKFRRGVIYFHRGRGPTYPTAESLTIPWRPYGGFSSGLVCPDSSPMASDADGLASAARGLRNAFHWQGRSTGNSLRVRRVPTRKAYFCRQAILRCGTARGRS